MIALLTGAVMFALGLFFGWLLHRERVERALYDDAVRARDRANTTLAETSARLELANRDLVRLRDQLTDAQHRLERQDDTIAQLEREHADAGADSDDPSAVDDDGTDRADAPVAAAGGRRGRPTGPPPVDAQLFDLDAEVDITEEVALPSVDGTPVSHVEDAERDVGPGISPAPPVEGVVDVEDDAENDAEAAAENDAENDVEGGPPSSTVEDDAPVVPAPDAAASDDLRLISGVGPALERLLHEHGITTFRDLALLDDAAIEDLRSRSPRLVTRLRRDAWVSQARQLHIETHGDEP